MDWLKGYAMILRKANIDWKTVVISVCAVLCLLVVLGCGTVRGVVDGLESTGAGVIQDINGAIDGIDRAVDPDGDEG